MSQNTQEVLTALFPILLMLIGAFVVGGLTIASAFVMTSNSILKSPVILSFLEKLYSGTSPEAQAALIAALAVANEVTDGIPAETKGNARASAANDL